MRKTKKIRWNRDEDTKRMRDDREKEKEREREREGGRERAAVKLGFIDFVLWHTVGGWLSLGISSLPPSTPVPTAKNRKGQRIGYERKRRRDNCQGTRRSLISLPR